MRLHETIYKQAGAVHGCALATNEPAQSEILMFVEDVGRHNAVDAIAGQMWLDRIDGGDKIFYTTGRLTSEMVIKAAQMGIPFLVSRSGLTQMGYEIAQKVGITMIGRATEQALPAVHRRRALRDRELSAPDAAPDARRRSSRPLPCAARVRFVARFPSRFCAHCHCESCRRAHGAGVRHLGRLSVGAGDGRRTAPTTSPRTSRRRERRRRFCRVCGTKLFFESARWAGETHVALAAFDEPVDRAARRATRSSTSTSRGCRALADARPVTVRRDADVTGIVLAGGQGRRMGGVDKGWSSSTAGRWSRTCSSASRRRSATS